MSNECVGHAVTKCLLQKSKESTMNFDRFILLALAVWALLFGIIAVTNIRVEWGTPLMGFAALVTGVLCLIRVVSK